MYLCSLSLSIRTARTTPIVLDFVTPNVETSPRFEAEVTGQYAKLYLMRWIMATSVQLFNWTKFTQVYIFGIERKGDTRSMNDEWKGETKYKTKSNLFRRSVDKLFLRR